ncbi:MAG TPA: RpiB/LacA/LacB family sugar-phosphate isomerase [Anaerolineae bacterium]|nr:RpiB/LacA/LacB family sugar-phosphate isomerase [Anaerolineae bacterium]HIQ05045.1 RpiB/LacA/LacB family sugar-phosphate isomerase [Anaerolineae bacterium]
MRIAVGSDEKTHLTSVVITELQKRGHKVMLYGPLLPDNHDLWPDVGRAVGEAVATGVADEGVLFCWTGTGVSIAANKVPGVRAALCTDAETARGARVWNHANVLVMSLRLTSEEVAKEMLEAWFSTPYGDDPVDQACVAKIASLDEMYRQI